VDKETIVDNHNFQRSIPEPLGPTFKPEQKTSKLKYAHEIYNTYQFTCTSEEQIRKEILDIWWDKDKENRRPVKATHNFDITREPPNTTLLTTSYKTETLSLRTPTRTVHSLSITDLQ
jgi:hypothetical protein